jgi:capsular exopolysaccharide synthesis family protein
VERDVSQNYAIASYRQQVDTMDMAVNDLSIRFGPNHADTKSAKSRLDQLKNKLADEEARVRDQTTEFYRSILQQKANGAALAKQALDQRVTALTAEIADLQAKRNEVERLNKDRDEYRAKLDKVKDEQDKLGLIMGNEKLSPVEWSAQPDMPDHPSFPRLSIVMAVALMLGLALSLGIAFLREMTDNSVRSPRDVARVGQMTLLGMIPHVDDDPQVTGARLPLAIYEAPHSMIAEQFRQVRTRLQHIASLDTTRSLLVTGCSPEDGKTMVAANLAAGLALNGRRILLVDANFRRPSIHTVFSVSNQIGFGDVLNEPTAFDEAVRATEVPNLSVMPLGNRPSNATELLESQLLIDFIERALEDFDHVIFDGGPLLMVSDAIALAPRVDGVVTVVRARGNSRGLLQRVRDELRRLKAEHLGVILNAVRVQGGGYYGPMIKTYYAYQNR